MKIHKARAILFTALAILLSLSQNGWTVRAQSFDWKKYAGTTVHFLTIQGPWIDAVKGYIPKFQEATGIQVDLQVFPEDQVWDKIQVEMQGKSQTLDAYLGQVDRFGARFSDNGWYEPLDKYIADPALTAPDFDWKTDFLDYSKTSVNIKGKIIAVPTERNLGPILFYREDLLKKYGISVPKTLAELEDAAKKVYEASNHTIAGIVNRGKGASATSQFAAVLHEFGARWEDAQGNPTINTPEAIAAFDWWGRTLRETGEQGATTFAFAETVNEFLTGKAAFAIEGGPTLQDINNPSKSAVVGKVGYSVIPAGPGGPAVRQTNPCKAIGPFALSISAFSTHKEAAWYLVQWLASKDAQTDFLVAGRMAARNSAWSSANFTQSDSFKANQEFWTAIHDASEICYPTPGNAPPSIKDVSTARDIVGQVIVASILGQDVKAAADQAEQDLIALKTRQ